MSKQFLILEVVKDLGSGIADLVPLRTLMTWEAAEEFVRTAMNQHPASRFVIQEVGTA